MTVPTQVHKLLERATAILPLSDEDLIYKGIAASVSERIITLKRTKRHLQDKYGSLNALQKRIQTEGVSPDDHTLYTDKLEWEAINHELKQLLDILETI